MPPHLAESVEIFCSYAHKDESLREELEAHLSSLMREGKIKHWHDRMIQPGENWKDKIDEHLDRAHIILLLISSDFLESHYCHEIEMRRAMERAGAKEARVIPVILRPCYWESSPFSKLQALPEGVEAVTEWPSRDAAFKNVAANIRMIVEEILDTPTAWPPLKGNDLPRPPAGGFVARRDKLNRDLVEYVTQMLVTSNNSWITLWGEGGVGKSTLAIEIARKWAEDCGGRVVLSHAEKKADYTLGSLLKDIFDGLEPDIPPLHLGARKARAYALVAEAPTLILLETYEKIAPDARQRIMEWIDHAQCVKLFTSQEEVRNTPNITIDPMTPAEARELIEGLISHSEFRDSFTEDIFRRIYEATEGRPYLIVWVVQEITSGSVPRTVFEELRQGKGDAAERIFNRYFNLPQVGDDGRAALLALSLFVPHATRPALAAVAGFPGDDARLKKVIKNLLKLKLIKGDYQNEHFNQHFALEGLPLDMTAARLPKSKYAAGIWRRFVTYFRDHALTNPNYDWATPEDPAAPRAEKSNIIRAIQVAPCIKDWDTVVELYDSWPDFMRISFKAWVTAIWLAEEYAEKKIGLKSQLPPLIIEIRHKDKEKTRRHYEGIATKLDEGKRWKRVVLSAAKFELGVFAYHRGDYPLAHKLLEEAQALQKKINHNFGVAMTCNNLGVVLAKQGRKAEAESKFREALEIFTSERQRLDYAKAKDRHREVLCNFEDFRPYEKRKSCFAKWWTDVKDKILRALFNIKNPASAQKKGARFARAVMLNLQWLERL